VKNLKSRCGWYIKVFSHLELSLPYMLRCFHHEGLSTGGDCGDDSASDRGLYGLVSEQETLEVNTAVTGV